MKNKARFEEILILLEKLPKEANYFGTVDKLKYIARKGIEDPLDDIDEEEIKKTSHQGK